MALEQMDLEFLGPHLYIYTNKLIYILVNIDAFFEVDINAFWADIDAFDPYKCLCPSKFVVP